MEAVYKPASAESRWTKIWLERGIFHGRPDPSKKPFSMVIPPPNITGSLHMGHALNNTIQDILNRWKRMQGFETCWFPGTDHAGIATQVVVERELRKEGKTRFDLGREKFVERAWAWREEYGGIIDKQLQQLGVSCDWDRYSFTMDEIRSRAVREAFVRLFKKGMIYRDRYIVNWCPKCQTALSDLEVEHPENEASGTLYYLKYPLEDSPGESITIATVRPETILADAAVAVHPEDPRYKKLVGKRAVLPLVGRKLKIIADEWADPKVGSGAVKITPAHDPNDFEVGRRHDLKPIIALDRFAKITLAEIKTEKGVSIGALSWLEQNYEGLDRFECRKKIAQDLKEKGFLVKEEPWPSNPGRCARSGDIVEPHLSVQWFVRMKDLAKPALAAVRDGRIQFHPPRFAKLYFDWMENIRDWCVSRQLWWGHRIPAWYCRDCGRRNMLWVNETDPPVVFLEAKPIVAVQKPVCPVCGKGDLVQDPDVLDTWFSSGLWPLSVMGWPAETPEQNFFYPTSILSTGRDIIFLWVARMIMFGLEFKKEVPFRRIYIHPTILDREGKRMSKSKGTGVDPLNLIAKYGADATRFGMTLFCQGQDVRFNDEKIEQARNFANKVWNASRFVLSSLQALSDPLGSSRAKQSNSEHNVTRIKGVSPLLSGPSSLEELGPLKFYDRWILWKLSRAIESVTSDLEGYEFAAAASKLYDFVWDDFCDWYLELSKLAFQNGSKERRFLTAAILSHVLSRSLKLLHPFMPFLTEEIWDHFKRCHSERSEESAAKQKADPSLRSGGLLLNERWPAVEKNYPLSGEPLMETFIEVVKAVRNLRAEAAVNPREKVPLVLRTVNKESVKTMEKELLFMAQASSLTVPDGKQPAPAKALSAHFTGGSVFLPLVGLVDIAAEMKRLTEERGKTARELEGVKKLLRDPDFSGKAKPGVVEKTKAKEKLLSDKLARLEERISLLL